MPLTNYEFEYYYIMYGDIFEALLDRLICEIYINEIRILDDDDKHNEIFN